MVDLITARRKLQTRKFDPVQRIQYNPDHSKGIRLSISKGMGTSKGIRVWYQPQGIPLMVYPLCVRCPVTQVLGLFGDRIGLWSLHSPTDVCEVPNK